MVLATFSSEFTEIEKLKFLLFKRSKLGDYPIISQFIKRKHSFLSKRPIRKFKLKSFTLNCRNFTPLTNWFYWQ